VKVLYISLSTLCSKIRRHEYKVKRESLIEKFHHLYHDLDFSRWVGDPMIDQPNAVGIRDARLQRMIVRGVGHHCRSDTEVLFIFFGEPVTDGDHPGKAGNIFLA